MGIIKPVIVTEGESVDLTPVLNALENVEQDKTYIVESDSPVIFSKDNINYTVNSSNMQNTITRDSYFAFRAKYAGKIKIRATAWGKGSGTTAGLYVYLNKVTKETGVSEQLTNIGILTNNSAGATFTGEGEFYVTPNTLYYMSAWRNSSYCTGATVNKIEVIATESAEGIL